MSLFLRLFRPKKKAVSSPVVVTRANKRKPLSAASIRWHQHGISDYELVLEDGTVLRGFSSSWRYYPEGTELKDGRFRDELKIIYQRIEWDQNQHKYRDKKHGVLGPVEASKKKSIVCDIETPGNLLAEITPEELDVLTTLRETLSTGKMQIRVYVEGSNVPAKKAG